MKTRKTRKTSCSRVRSRNPSSRASFFKNQENHWNAYKQLQKRVDKAWVKLRSDVRRHANPQILIRDRNQLLLLLGECNYMARECTRFATHRPMLQQKARRSAAARRR